MAGQLLQHVVEEADARCNVVGAGAVEVDAGLDLGLLGGALDAGLPLHVGCLACLAGPKALSAWARHFHRPEPALASACSPLIYRPFMPTSAKASPMTPMNDVAPSQSAWHGTTILTVRKSGKVVIAGDGQVSLGATVI